MRLKVNEMKIPDRFITDYNLNSAVSLFSYSN